MPNKVGCEGQSDEDIYDDRLNDDGIKGAGHDGRVYDMSLSTAPDLKARSYSKFRCWLLWPRSVTGVL